MSSPQTYVQEKAAKFQADQEKGVIAPKDAADLEEKLKKEKESFNS